MQALQTGGVCLHLKKRHLKISSLNREDVICNVLPNQLCIIMLIFMFLIFFSSLVVPIRLNCQGECCFAVKPQKCYWTTTATFHRHGGAWTHSLMVKNLAKHGHASICLICSKVSATTFPVISTGSCVPRLNLIFSIFAGIYILIAP